MIIRAEIFWSEQKKKVLFRLLDDVYIFGYQIPDGFETDFASVPKSLWNILPPIGKHNQAALIHDYLYDNKIGTRLEADRLFLKVMIESGVNIVPAYIMYLGVRIGGRKWWKE